MLWGGGIWLSFKRIWAIALGVIIAGFGFWCFTHGLNTLVAIDT